jgi:hypothetical protein
MLGFNRGANYDAMFYVVFNSEVIVLLLLGTLFSTPIAPWFYSRLVAKGDQVASGFAPTFLRLSAQTFSFVSVVAVFLYSLALVAGNQKNPFIYFRF